MTTTTGPTTDAVFVELPLPIPELPAPPGDQYQLAKLMELTQHAATRLGRVRGQVTRTTRALRTTWLAGPGRESATEAAREHGTAVGVESAACALASAGLRRYAQAMTKIRNRHSQLCEDVGGWHSELRLLTSYCHANGEVPAQVSGQARALHERRSQLLARHSELHAAASAAAREAARVFTRAANLTKDDLARLDRLVSLGHRPDQALILAFSDQFHGSDSVVGTRSVELDRGTPPDKPHYDRGSYQPGTGSVVPLMPCPYPKGGGTPGQLPGGTGPLPGGGSRPGVGGRQPAKPRNEGKHRYAPGDNSYGTRKYGRSVADIKGQAERYARRERAQGRRVYVGAVRYGKYGYADVTVTVLRKDPRRASGWSPLPPRHFIYKGN